MSAAAAPADPTAGPAGGHAESAGGHVERGGFGGPGWRAVWRATAAALLLLFGTPHVVIYAGGFLAAAAAEGLLRHRERHRFRAAVTLLAAAAILHAVAWQAVGIGAAFRGGWAGPGLWRWWGTTLLFPPALWGGWTLWRLTRGDWRGDFVSETPRTNGG